MKNLKMVMLINSLSSGATGLIMVIFSRPIAALFEVSTVIPFIAIGIFLIAFSILVLLVSRNTQNTGAVKFVIMLDVSWVIASLALATFQLFGLSLIGYWLILGVAVWVALMAFLQFIGMNKLVEAR